MNRRPHDVGGLDIGEPLDPHDDGAPFHHEWEARVFALNRVLLRTGLYTLDEFRYALERIDPETRAAKGYYERWLIAIETLLDENGTPDALCGG